MNIAIRLWAVTILLFFTMVAIAPHQASAKSSRAYGEKDHPGKHLGHKKKKKKKKKGKDDDDYEDDDKKGDKKDPLDVFIGVVIDILDGKTIKVKDIGDVIRVVRIADIDAPDKDKKSGGNLIRSLTKRLKGKKVKIHPRKVDNDGRVISRVKLGNEDISEYIVKNGLGWVENTVAADDPIAELERAAKSLRKGLWAEPELTR